MSFQTPISIANAIENINKNKFLLPAIQREFVWSSDKIEWLFDSIMRDYPISSFLFWEVDEDTSQHYKFYKFISEYRERFKTHNEEISTNGIGSFQAILDGQQRLTSLYIGLKGSFASKEYRKKWEDTEVNIPTRQLYLNLSRPLTDEEDGRIYEFKFLPNYLTKNQTIYNEQDTSWFKVGEILNMANDVKFDEFVDNLDEVVIHFDKKFSKRAIRQLRQSIIKEKLINYFLEKEQNIDKALNIFIRINSGGEPLSFSDLIMSIAVANWQTKDARREIHLLVDNIRDKGFNISKDLILKAFLYLHSKDIKFKVNNFSKDNAQQFEQEWEEIRNTILSVFDLIKSFGFDDKSLSSKNAVLPIIYYLYHKKIYSDFTNKIEFKEDRKKIVKWLHISLLKQIFSGSSDAVLSQIRRAFSENISDIYIQQDIDSFPSETIYTHVRNQDLSISEEFIENLLATQYEDSQAFSILSLLFPHLDYKNVSFHKDHLHPQNQFSDLPINLQDSYPWRKFNSIINLQMLDGYENQSKNNKNLDEWINEFIKNLPDKLAFFNAHLIPTDISNLSINNFDEFYEKRHTLLKNKLNEILN